MEQNANLQVNIVEGHGRDYAFFVPGFFLQNDKTNVPLIRTFIQRLGNQITTQEIQNELKKYPDENRKKSVVGWAAFSYFGLMNAKILINNIDPGFKSSMRKRTSEFHDYPNNRENGTSPETINPEGFYSYRGGQKLGFLLCFASDSVKSLMQKVEEIERDPFLSNRSLCNYKIEWAYRKKEYPTAKVSLGPLDFIDGLAVERDEKVKRSNILVSEQHDGSVIGYGSFLVFRKMRVRKNEFKRLISTLAREFEISLELAEALYMGRFKNGFPLGAMPEQGMDLNLIKSHDFNKGIDLIFDYSKEDGLVCPVRAHVRVVNPRNNGPAAVSIVRRSMLFSNKHELKGTSGEGMYFISYQKNIEDQFVPLLNRMRNGRDALFYRTTNTKEKISFPKAFNNSNESGKSFDMGGPNLTQFLGGETFYVPSPAFFNKVSSADPAFRVEELPS